MKYPFITLVFCFGALFNSSSIYSQETALLDSIVAIVNEDVISKTQLDAEVIGIKLQLAERGIQSPPENILLKQVLERMILEQLQIQEAERFGIVIDDTMLNTAMRDIAAQNNLSLEQFRKNLLKDGVNYIDYRESIRKQIMVTHVTQGYISSKIDISDQEVDDFLSNESLDSEKNVKYLVSHILISTPEAARPEDIQASKKRITEIYEQLKQGGNFTQLAIANSEARTALEGGSLGWKQLNELPSLFAKNVGVLKRKQFSKPIRSPGGFHILYLEDKKGDSRHIVKQVHARHILVVPNAVLDDDAARKKLVGLRKQILQGKEFADIAKSHSEDPGSAVNGGNLDWAEPKIYAKKFRNVIETLPINKVSEPFKSQFGWHIVEVLGRRDHDDTDEFRRAKAHRSIFNRKAAEEEQLWMRKLRDTAYIVYKLDDD